jgi:hypothetical protein
MGLPSARATLMLAGMVDTVVSVFFANGLTLWLFYGVWRIRRNERDMTGILMCLGALVVIGLFAYAAHLQQQG